MHNLLFCVHTLCMSYVIKTFLLVSSSVSSKQLLCFVHDQGKKREQKYSTKNFVEFHNHSSLITMSRVRILFIKQRSGKQCSRTQFKTIRSRSDPKYPATSSPSYPTCNNNLKPGKGWRSKPVFYCTSVKCNLACCALCLEP